MQTCVKRLRIPAISLFLAACVLMPAHTALHAGTPTGARYNPLGNEIFWFIHASDLHIGMSGSNDTTRLQWLVTTARNVIQPSFIVATGDLTDSTNGNILGIPNGPHQTEWDQYKAIVDGAGAGPDFFYDIPGNHDAYSDAAFQYYLLNSVQGRATGGTQVSWTRDFSFDGTYHFLGVNSAGNDGRAFSLAFPYGDNAGLDSGELKFIGDELAAHSTARLTFVFGHHPVTDTGQADDTWLFYGQQGFVGALDTYRASSYSYGHTHDTSQSLFTGNSDIGTMSNGGIHYNNVASLGKSSALNYTLVAVDSDGVSSVTRTVNSWPLVLITAPVDRLVGGAVNPYAYTVPAASDNFVRALVFDTGTISLVQFRIDGNATWFPMTRAAGSHVWQGAWNASALAVGNHTIEVQATGTATVSDAITVGVASAGNRAPVANGDKYSTNFGTTLTVAAPGVLANDTDPDGPGMTAAIFSTPGHGTVTLGSGGGFTYKPATGFSGTDTFTYTASDGTATSAPATVTITVNAAPTADTVTIVSVTYNSRRSTLSVSATSSAQPNALLTVMGLGQMTYKTKTKSYTFTATVNPKPDSVTVTSSRGGSATVPVI